MSGIAAGQSHVPKEVRYVPRKVGDDEAVRGDFGPHWWLLEPRDPESVALFDRHRRGRVSGGRSFRGARLAHRWRSESVAMRNIYATLT